MSIRVGIDTGGTFTDFVVMDAGRVRVHKCLSTPGAPHEAIVQGLRELGLLGRGDVQIVHGSTVATNAVLEGKGARTAFVTNRGFADLLTLGRQARAALYDLNPPPVPPPVAADWCFEVTGRMDAQGDELTPLDAAEVAELQRRLAPLPIEAIAITMLFSFKNPAHEQMLAAALGERIFVAASYDVLPEYREYERGVATWLNAYVGPKMQAYLQALAEETAPATLRVMESSGGTADAQGAARRGVHLLLSGPAGGVRGAWSVGRDCGFERVLGVDIGGTSTDVAAIVHAPQITLEGRVAGYPVAVPMVDIHTVGAGGGSLAQVDAGGLLQVGPASAGALPGPACYGRGGRQPTVTDAHVVLGHIPANTRLGGRIALQVAAARGALATLAETMGCGIEDAARGIIRIANEHMAAALRVISVQRGFDPKGAALIAFGGGGGLHVCALAEALGMRTAIVPAHAGVLSAWGMLVSPVQRVWTTTWVSPLNEGESRAIDNKLAELQAIGHTWLAAEGIAPADRFLSAGVDLRYRGQAYALPVAWQGVAASQQAFHDAYRRQYGYQLDQPIEVVRLQMYARGPQPEPPAMSSDQDHATAAPVLVPIHGIGEVPCVSRGAPTLVAGVRGPAVVLDSGATLWIPAGWHARRAAENQHIVMQRI